MKKGMLAEFKEFAIKGNMMDMAVGIIIGAGFGKIITSLVSDIIMPPIGLLLGNVNFTDLKLVLREAGVDAVANPAVTWNYGNFIQVVIDFVIVAFCVFLVVKALNRVRDVRKKDETPAPAAPPEPTTEEKLLTEIRDLLKKDSLK